ncbi:hypothetical protein BDR03DRAFT_1009235 [Suillus americanus]|nr:hypothetical protein BDR03DRAFT_1009235 [Suillus americanus]
MAMKLQVVKIRLDVICVKSGHTSLAREVVEPEISIRKQHFIAMDAQHSSQKPCRRPASEFKKRVRAQNEERNNSELLMMAWADLVMGYPAHSFVADVDLECLTTLDARIFEDSEEAGTAGNQQGNVYLNIPTEWVLGRDYSGCELEHGPLFSNNSDATAVDELSDIVAPSLPASEEEIVPVKRRPSLLAEECAPLLTA